MKKLFIVLIIVLAFSTTPAKADSTAIADSAVGVNDVGNVNQTFEATEEIPRSFPNGTEVGYPSVPMFIGPDRPGPNTMDLSGILNLKQNWIRAELEETASKAKMWIRSMYLVQTRDTLDIEENDIDSVILRLGIPPAGSKLLGIIMVRIRNTKGTTVEAMSEAGLKGLECMADAVYIVAYNSQKVVKASGWGIGVHHSGASVDRDNRGGSVSSGGTGWSTGEAGYQDKPWVHAYCVRLP